MESAIAENLLATSIIKGTLINSLFEQTSSAIGTTAKEYSINWEDYDILLLQACQYSNIRTSIVAPCVYFKTTTSGSRPTVRDTIGDIMYEVWQNGNGSVYVKASKSDNALRLRIYGIKFK